MPRKPSYDRDALIDRARDLFWRKGWAGTSLKDLEKALNLRTGSFYAAFGSKDALYEHALDRYAADGLARLDALEAELGPLGALKAQPLRVIMAKERPANACMLAKTLLELQPQDHALAQAAEKHLHAMEARFADLFRAAQSKGEIAPHHDPEVRARRYQSDLMGLRASAERKDVDAVALAQDIASDLDALTVTE